MRARPPLSDLFAKITAPTLILKADAHGELRQQSEKVASILKRGQIVHIEGAGHNVRRDEKQRTLAALKPFLAKFARNRSRSQFRIARQSQRMYSHEPHDVRGNSS